MINTIHRLKEFLKYQQSAKTKYYLHSPFVYQFYLHVLEGSTNTEIQNINKLRKRLLQTYDKIVIEDMGAAPGSKEKRVSDICAKASMPDKYGKVLYRLVDYVKPDTILELGTCLGLGTAYLASADPTIPVTTIEGSKALSEYAKSNFKQLRINNIRQVQGSFEEQLPELLNGIPKVGMAFIDGNHRYEPTMKYFDLLMQKSHQGTILVFDDIYWSKEMTQAWNEIKLDPRITLTIDIYRFGIAFINREKLAKEDFILRY
jgi:predicted O-methyltransferase YrrM